MSPLEFKLRRMDEFISISNVNLDHYTNDFTFLHGVILRCMITVDPVFAMMYRNSLLIGSVPMNTCLYLPDEFDVLVNLAFPFHNDLRVIYMSHFPGFLQLDLSKIMYKMRRHQSNYFIYQLFLKLVDPQNFLLNRSAFQFWIKQVFFHAMNYIRHRLWNSNGDFFQLQYKPRGITHTIIAHKNGGSTNGGSTIKIDFVGTIQFESHRFYHNVLHATPWGAMQSSLYLHDHTFFVSNPSSEFNCFQHAPKKLISVVRLLKFACANKKIAPHFKSYFITNVLLWEMSNQPPQFWHKSLNIIFVHMMKKIIYYLENSYLPYYWNHNFNLFCYLSYEQCFIYKNKFTASLEKFLNTHWG